MSILWDAKQWSKFDEVLEDSDKEKVKKQAAATFSVDDCHVI